LIFPNSYLQLLEVICLVDKIEVSENKEALIVLAGIPLEIKTPCSCVSIRHDGCDSALLEKKSQQAVSIRFFFLFVLL
jgi:AbrB family looped-hinge helix DNA binding protein